MKLSLELAAEAAEVADWAAAIAALHAAWQAKRLPQLGALIAQLDARQAALPIVGKTVAAREAMWRSLAQDPDEAVVPRLLATPWPIKPKDASARIAALAARAPSPRIAHALIALHARGQYASAAGRKLSRQIFRMLNAQQDPIVTAYLDDFEASEPTAALRDNLQAVLRSLIARERVPIPEPTAREATALARLAALAKTETATDRPAHARLLAAVYAAPFDDGPREVFADLLSETGDPRGELIMLQLARARGTATAKSIARERALLRAAGTSWNGGLEADGAEDIAHARGFPVRARLARTSITQPAWATVEELALSTSRAVALRDVPQLRALRVLRHVLGRHLGRTEVPHPEQLDELVVCGSTGIEASTPLAPRILGITHVESARLAQLAASIATWPVGRRVVELSCMLHVNELAVGLAMLAAAPQLEVVALGGTTVDYHYPRWTTRISRTELALRWSGDGQTHAELAQLALVLRDLPMHPRVATVTIVATGKVAAVALPPVERALRPIVAAWPGKPALIVNGR